MHIPDPMAIPDPKAFNPISWWNDAKPSLQLYAFDTLAIPAMFAEREKGLSSAKNLITPERNGGHHRNIGVLEELVGMWANSAV